MKVESKTIDVVLRQEIAWHRSEKARKTTGYTPNEKRAFIKGLQHVRRLLAKIVKEIRNDDTI